MKEQYFPELIDEYTALFWAPLLGETAWHLYLLVKMTGPRLVRDGSMRENRFSAHDLAQQLRCDKRAVVGYRRKVKDGHPGASQDQDGHWYVYYAGALDHLVKMGVGAYTKSGQSPHTIYTIRVLINLPALTSDQVEQLPPFLTTLHAAQLTHKGVNQQAVSNDVELDVNPWDLDHPFGPPDYDREEAFMGRIMQEMGIEHLCGPTDAYAPGRTHRCD